MINHNYMYKFKLHILNFNLISSQFKGASWKLKIELELL